MSLSIALLIFLALANTSITTIEGTPDTTVLQQICSGGTWAPNGPYEAAVTMVLDALEINTYYYYAYDDYYVTRSSGGATVYGEAHCNDRLTLSDCVNCLDFGVDQLAQNCPDSVSALIAMDDCYLRYADFPIDN